MGKHNADNRNVIGRHVVRRRAACRGAAATAASTAAASATAAEAAAGKMPPMRPDRPTHEMMEAKLADRLNLSKEQYLAMQDRRKADQVKIRDLMDQMNHGGF